MYQDIFGQLLSGFGTTLALFVIVLVFSIPLGLVVCFGEMSRLRILRSFTRGFVWVIRGTPLMLQILLISMLPKMLFGVMNKNLASVFGVSISSLLFIFVCVAFIINYACYFSEIYRAGIESIDKGQYEAGKVLGMSKTETFFKIILMQVIKRIVPPMSNEIITLVKDTALAQILGVVDLLSSANHAVNQYVVLTPLLIAAIFYLVFSGGLTVLFNSVEKRFKRYEG